MALTIALNSQVVNSVVRAHTLRITKQGSTEQAVLTIQDRTKTLRPAVGDILHVDQDGTQLEMGGEVTRVLADLADYEWRTTIHVRGWAFEADEVEVDLFTVPSSTVLGAAASSLVLGYLGGKGWTTLTGTGDGPYLAPGTYRAMMVGDILRDWEDQTDIPWRVNGNRQFAFDTGSLPAPTSFTASNRTVIKGATWSQDRVRLASRIRAVTAGRSEDYFAHVEAHTADGVKTIFPVNAIAQEVEATVTTAYSAGVSTLAVTGLPPSRTLRAGLTLRAATHGPYSLSAAASVDGSGNATLALGAPLVGELVAEERIALDNGALVSLVVNSTATALDGSAGWQWDPIASQLVAASLTPSNGTVVRYLVSLKHPVTVRSWTAGTQQSSGAFNPASIRDARIARIGDIDLAQTHQRNLTELARRLSQPKTFTIETDYEGHLYPWMYAPCAFPADGISGTYRIQNVEITDIGRRNERPRIKLDMIEGYEQDWRQDWRTNVAVAATAARAGTVSGGGSSGSSGGTGGVYVGLSLPLGGSNIQLMDLTTSWQDISEAIPIDHPSDVTGTWSFRPCAYQVRASTPTVPVELRLLIDGTPVSSVSTSAFNSIVDTAGFGYPSASYSAPTGGVCLVQARVPSLTATAVVGHARTTKTA